MGELSKINACAKRPIDIWTNYLYYPMSIAFVYLIRKTPLSPNGVTVLSLVTCLAGCAGFFLGTRTDEIAGLIVTQIAYVFDCADGQLARYRQQFSSIGGWLDQVADRVKEFAIYFSLAYGYVRNHPGDTSAWQWATLAVFALYLLEYFGQIRLKSADSASQVGARGRDADQAGALLAEQASQFARLQRWRSFIPFRGFIIGEQYFAMLVFLMFGLRLQLLMFVSVLGLTMCVYRPIVQLYKFQKRLA
ncbi:CDP-alcohol phosphatidyltransferase family protein [Alicyclobacillus acidiphilus]|uniref:CDP-alcohol phosphatidyltransferase family protein n=1 Tax=Alicyclobacillus acidiphilus TaxID=182455 RepID=UPI000830BBD0|nr:CDP-alcohol phosphatidyltransferase family protein [Alicyclobacillus acidiphilus]